MNLLFSIVYHVFIFQASHEKSESFGDKVKHVGDTIKHEIEKDVDKLAEVTHLKPWYFIFDSPYIKDPQLGRCSIKKAKKVSWQFV